MSQDRFRTGVRLPARGVAFVAVRGALAMVLSVGLCPEAFAQLPAPARSPKVATTATQDAVPAALPDAVSVLERHEKAIGGRDEVKRLSSTYAKGTMTMPSVGLSGPVELFAAKPNKQVTRVSLPGVGEVVEGFDGKYGWSINPMTGPMLIDGKQLEERKFDSEFPSERKLEERYASMKTLERTEFDGRQCYKLQLVRKSGGEDIEFYDVGTGLKAGSIVTRETPMGTITATSVETDYRKFGNLLHATTIRNQIGPVQQVITISAVEYDAVPASAFDVPASIKALIK
jgi:hypothetical protein